MSETAGYRFHHTMIRVKDIKKSLDFYERILGLRLCHKLDFAESKFSLYFLAYISKDEVIPEDLAERSKWIFGNKSAFIELTHNWGTEDDPNFSYHNGNKEPRGFGHLAIVVPDVYAAVARMEKEGVKILKKPDDGRMKGFAFVEDPDGYWYEHIVTLSNSVPRIEVLKDDSANGTCC